MSTGSNNSVDYYAPIASLRCKCGQPVKVLTSNTDANPGRRYGFCNVLGGCDFWRWVEPDECSPKAKALIRKHKVARQGLEEEISRMKCARQADQEELSRVNARHEPMTRKLVVVEKVLACEELEKVNGGLKEKLEHLESALATSQGAEVKWKNIAIICLFLLVCKIVGL